MFYFLLPTSFCAKLEGVISQFWLKCHGGRGGIHWCTQSKLCKTKDSGGLGFQNLAKFNVALLAKQGWHLINYPNSLFARVLKANYYLQCDFLHANLGSYPSYLWKSLWSANGLLHLGLSLRMGMGYRV